MTSLSRGLTSHLAALKGTARYVKWRLLRRLGYDPHQIHKASVVGCYRASIAIFKDSEP